VQNLFHSVQLNVNNPHFLIMQGRITKVLNMKPAEILSMLEEVRCAAAAQLQRLTPRGAGCRHAHVRDEEGERPQDARQEADQG
jgi:hypothetical protein